MKQQIVWLLGSLLFQQTVAKHEQQNINLEIECKGPTLNQPQNYLDVDPIDVNALDILNRHMCSYVCPCPELAKKQYFDMGPQELGFFLRTDKAPANSTIPEYLDFTNNGTTYTSFKQCWQDVIKPQNYYEYDTMQAMDNYLELWDVLESKNCSGVCYTGLFWFTRSIYEPRPTQACWTSIDNPNRLANQLTNQANIDYISQHLIFQNGDDEELPYVVPGMKDHEEQEAENRRQRDAWYRRQNRRRWQTEDNWQSALLFLSFIGASFWCFLGVLFNFWAHQAMY